MTLAQLKLFFRQVIKVVAGGPPVGTPGANRAQGLLDALDQLAEFADAATAGSGPPAQVNMTTAGAGAVNLAEVSQYWNLAGAGHIDTLLNPGSAAVVVVLTSANLTDTLTLGGVPLDGTQDVKFQATLNGVPWMVYQRGTFEPGAVTLLTLRPLDAAKLLLTLDPLV